MRPISSPHILENRGGGGKEAQGTNTASAEACRLFFFFFNLLFFFFLVLGQDLCETDHRGKAEAPHTDRV